MRVVEIRESFGSDSLQLVERPEPVPGPAQVLLKMKAFSINYRELLVVNGVGRWKPPLGRVPVSDGVGIVVAAGTDVSRVTRALSESSSAFQKVYFGDKAVRQEVVEYIAIAGHERASAGATAPYRTGA